MMDIESVKTLASKVHSDANNDNTTRVLAGLIVDVANLIEDPNKKPLPPYCESFKYNPITDVVSGRQKWIAPLEAIPGKFYESSKWGRMICCGSSNPEDLLPAFAIRDEHGRCSLKYLDKDHGVSLSDTQAWT